jgi:hypothetical protein
MKLKRKGDKLRYEFVDAGCLGRECFQPGVYQHRGATLSGSRNTGEMTPCCMRRAYHGCPSGPVGEREEECDCPGKPHGTHVIQGLPEIMPLLVKERKAVGWRAA